MRLEEELLELRQENNDLHELLAQRDELIAHLQQRVQMLEERLAKDSHNSHLPPSSDRFVRQPKSLRKKSGKQVGGQQGHKGTTLMWSESPDEVIVQAVTCCEHCQHDLKAVKPLQIERRQVVDVPAPRLLVQEYRAERKLCPFCQQVTAAAFPTGVDAPIQYGVRVGAIAIYLMYQQLLPWARACEVLADLLGVQISEGTLASLIECCAYNLREVEEHIKDALVKAEVLHQDETGLYVKGLRYWMHVVSTAQLTHYAVHPKRGKEALDAIGILPRFQGTSVHALLAHADATTPTAQAPPEKKGRAKQSAARNGLPRLIENQEAALAFLHRLVVPFDNNQAERDVRMVKVQQKVSGSFRSEAGATAFCRIRGYLSSLRKEVRRSARLFAGLVERSSHASYLFVSLSRSDKTAFHS